MLEQTRGYWGQELHEILHRVLIFLFCNRFYYCEKNTARSAWLPNGEIVAAMERTLFSACRWEATERL